ncbi:MAG TPA: inositol monophosphatase family protein [Ktedonobacteraceae bacterium]|nr:inositol monophosphatase family protein [Ktedonobacteraceae bacterium]
MDETKAREVAIEAAQAGGKILLDYYREGVYSTRIKEDTSLQTGADLAAEQAIIGCIQKAFPLHNIESEEQGRLSVSSSPYCWRIDPLDGTENFVLGLPYFSSTLTLCYLGQPQVAVVYNPVTDALYTAERGGGAWLNGNDIRVSPTTRFTNCRVFLIPDFATKRMPLTERLRHSLHMQCRRVLDTWSPALDWCLVACGKADLVVAISEQPVVPDAGILLLEEAGGRITDFQGESFTGVNQRCIVGSNGTEIHERFLQLVQNTSGEKEPWSEPLLSKLSYGMQ